jgi:coenzyme F420-reducing hydrogenase beta subunit
LSINKNVCTEVVAQNLCIGCGVCAGICPRGNLEINFNQYGEYNASETGIGCDKKCNLCLKVCPFYDCGENEDTIGKRLFAEIPEIKHTPETGYYLNTFVGYSNVDGHRENGASGGLATWTLEALLKQGYVDHVACVSQNDDPEKLFNFKVCSTPEDVRKCSRSCYYPVETSEIIEHILQQESRYAIVGLPCVCKAIRLAMQNNLKLQERIKLVLGLVCGQTKSKFFVEYICALGSGTPHHLRAVQFRVKDKNHSAADFGLRFSCTDGKNGVVFWKEGMNQIWCDRYFTLNPCDFCDDIFAECADAAFMDAWLPGYSKDPKGHNITIVRNRQLADVLASAIAVGSIYGRDITPKEVISSQQGVLDIKRGGMRTKRSLAECRGKSIPRKRLGLCKSGLSPIRGQLTKLTWQISQKSRHEWFSCDKNIQSFQEKVKFIRLKIELLRLIERCLHLPIALLKKMWGKLF